MKTLNTTAIFLLIFVTLFSTSCSKDNGKKELQSENEDAQNNDPFDPENESAGIHTPEDQLIEFSSQKYKEKHSTKQNGPLKFGWKAHENFTYICAINLGLPESRAKIMRDASIMPDVYQSGIDNAYNQQWSHAFIVTKAWWGFQWLWGDADDDFHDNLDGNSGESESPESYNEKWAGYYYARNNKDLGDWYVGYACHYIEDVSFVLHSTFPDVDMAVHHGDFEKWIDDNWNEGHKFAEVAAGVSIASYYSFSDPKEAIRNAAKASTWDYSAHGKKAWENYKASGYPTGVGTGNEDLVYFTGLMVAEATKWTGATIKYGLSKYNQW